MSGVPDARRILKTKQGDFSYYSLPHLEESGISHISRLPFTVKILLENVLRHAGGKAVSSEDVKALAEWNPQAGGGREIPFFPARVLLQDFTGVPCVADLAAMRDAVKRTGADPRKINPLVPVDLVVDHSVQVDFFGAPGAFERNVEKEVRRNRERYLFLRWAQQAFDNFRVVPPGTGICHQVNLEFFGRVVQSKKTDGQTVVFPDTLVGADSHTTMINGLGILGWGVGGIEAEACMLGQSLSIPFPEVIGFKLSGRLPEGATATDFVLAVTQILRKKGAVGKFVEFFGEGLSSLSLPDRATVSNMSPEYGATAALFPVDGETLRYLRATNRDPGLIELVEAYTKAQGLFRTDAAREPVFTQTLELDLKSVEPSLAGPRRPQDRISLGDMGKSFHESLKNDFGKSGADRVSIRLDGKKTLLADGSVVIAAITSCTNTSNPSVMIGAGLLARKAVEKGLSKNPAVKTSLAPGSRVVTDYLKKAGLLPYLEQLGFYLVGYGCTTCIGNSGPLPEPIAEAIQSRNLVAACVLSGNRNFDGRINPLARAAYLCSPPLVVAFALAGRVDTDLTADPVGFTPGNKPVYLRDIWPSQQEIQSTMEKILDIRFFKERYSEVFEGDENWKGLNVPAGSAYPWNDASTYIHPPPFLEGFSPQPPALNDIRSARVLVSLGDFVTTDHISPAGGIAADSSAGKYLIGKGVQPLEFNTYGARRGNHQVMARGTFANIRLKNLLVPGREGPWTLFHPTGETMTIFDAAEKYRDKETPLLAIAGKEYGAGSSRDWAAKGPFLLGIKAVIAESFERIHRSNLVGMGILPLQFLPGENRENLGLTGRETYEISGIAENLSPKKQLTVTAKRENGTQTRFNVLARLDGPADIEYYRNGGILPAILRQILTPA